jgi:hypothetical protein
MFSRALKTTSTSVNSSDYRYHLRISVPRYLGSFRALHGDCHRGLHLPPNRTMLSAQVVAEARDLLRIQIFMVMGM